LLQVVVEAFQDMQAIDLNHFKVEGDFEVVQEIFG